jgi:hypothetical protein
MFCNIQHSDVLTSPKLQCVIEFSEHSAGTEKVLLAFMISKPVFHNHIHNFQKTMHWDHTFHSFQLCLMIQVGLPSINSIQIVLCCGSILVSDVLQKIKDILYSQTMILLHNTEPVVLKSGMRVLKSHDSLTEAGVLSGDKLHLVLGSIGGMQSELENDLSQIENELSQFLSLERSMVSTVHQDEQRRFPITEIHPSELPAITPNQTDASLNIATGNELRNSQSTEHFEIQDFHRGREGKNCHPQKNSKACFPDTICAYICVPGSITSAPPSDDIDRTLLVEDRTRISSVDVLEKMSAGSKP